MAASAGAVAAAGGGVFCGKRDNVKQLLEDAHMIGLRALRSDKLKHSVCDLSRQSGAGRLVLGALDLGQALLGFELGLLRLGELGPAGQG